MAEFDWNTVLNDAMSRVVQGSGDNAVCVCEGTYVTDSIEWGYHGHFPETNFAMVFDATSAYEHEIPQEDGTDKNEAIDELKNLQDLVINGSRRPNSQGLFISGMKYTITRMALAERGEERGNDPTMLKVESKLDDQEFTVTFNKIFFASSSAHQILIAEDSQGFVYIAYANKENCGIEQTHPRLAEVCAIAAYYAGSADTE
eukprot:gb/GECG01012033.1/.p1 GENE.gb/GECG01012033.1/~~gb/GECG01012033.1/.p1  ORF type:complete len:202 (+),score=32.42 gb/GECG01012033.1/:1-606(+)